MHVKYVNLVNLLIVLLVNLHQVSANELKLSLLTCSAGEELYSAYGHTAIRLQDPDNKLDVVFNYGTFNFNTPNFYGKFLNGTLDYCLSVSHMQNFLASYRHENRTVVERDFILSSSQKQELADMLVDNSREENRYYRYDFFLDNCATRVRDIIYKVASKKRPSDEVASTSVTYRDCIHNAVGPNSWAGQGIDLILGKLTDKEIDSWGRALLPDSLEALFVCDKLVGDPKILYQKISDDNSQKSIINRLLTPSNVAYLLLLLTICLSVVEHNRGLWFKWLDIILLSLMTILSGLFAYLWFVSEIKFTSYNYNILWASILSFPTLVFLIIRPSSKIFSYLCCINLLQICVWTILFSFIDFQFRPVFGVVFSLILALRYVKILITNKR